MERRNQSQTNVTEFTLSLFLSCKGTWYVSNGLKFWNTISDGNGWNKGSSISMVVNYMDNNNKVLHQYNKTWVYTIMSLWPIHLDLYNDGIHNLKRPGVIWYPLDRILGFIVGFNNKMQFHNNLLVAKPIIFATSYIV